MMETEVWEDNVVFPCEPVSEEELAALIENTACGDEDDCESLWNSTFKITYKRIPWHSCHALYILGESDEDSNDALENAGFESGIYVNYSGSCLILIHLEESEIQTYIGRLGSLLKSLRLYNTWLTHLDVSSLLGLEELDILDNKKLTAINGLEHLTQLIFLRIAICHSLTQLPELNSLMQLTELDISGCTDIHEVPAWIRNIKSLRELNLSQMVLDTLPDWLPEIAERFSLDSFAWGNGKHKAIVCLGGTTVEDMEDMSIFEQPYEVVAKWFEERRLGRMRTLNEIKVVFLGDGESGKSHTVARLMNDGSEPKGYVDVSTPGIVIRNKEYDLGDRKITVHYWDFGGQEIMHSMHRIFLTGRTMYVILLNARDDTQGDRAKYWLHNVKSFAPDAPVLMVLNKIDQNENASVDEADLRSRYGKLTQVVRLSALKYNQDQFNNAFTKVLLDEIQKTGYLDVQWPISWTQVKERLENMESHHIMGDAYKDICAQCSVDEHQKELLHWFNDLGVSFCYDEDYALEDYVILRPDWITNALYIILFNHLEGARNGRIPHKSIYSLLKNAHRNPNIRCTLPNARYTGADIQYVLGVMRKFNLSFADGTEHEFIPMLCQQNSMVDVQYYRRDTEILEFHMEFDYLPNNLLHRLMVERHRELDTNTVWRTGARFKLTELGLSAVVVIDDRTLCFFIRHDNDRHRPNTYLAMLKANVDRIVKKMGLQPPTCQLIYKLDGKRDAFDFDYLKMLQEVKQTHALAPSHKKMIPIESILNQSAPEGLEDEKKLLEAILRSCRNIQGDSIYCLTDDGYGMEDKRNRRLRDDLYGWGYNVQDQTQRGRSGSGKSIGELDLLLHNENREPWTAVEALRISNGTKADWNKHLRKLVGHYDFFGARFSYLLTYVDAEPKAFERIWNGYRKHLQVFSPDLYAYDDGSFADLSDENFRYIHHAKCRYSCGGAPITVYHIFVRIPTKDE